MLFYCRAGFETDCAAEIEAVAKEGGVVGACEYRRDQAYVLWQMSPRERRAVRAWPPQVPAMVFARQYFSNPRRIEFDRPSDRVSPIVEGAATYLRPFSQFWLEAPDTDSGRRALAQARGIERPLRAALDEAGLLAAARGGPRLHVCWLAADSVLLGVSDSRYGSRWPMGIPRIRAPRGAPSRSGLKLVEALERFVGESALPARMRPGSAAVDLGAAPGGWSQVLANRGLHVVAVDHGRIADTVLATELVEHRRQDAFRFRPERPVGWMVCDVVAAPARIAALAAQWVGRGWCRETIFNLKLPNAARWSEIVRCRAVIETALSQVRGRHALRIKHLYHDREEVTAHLRRL